jgi:hypothetical protein
MSRNTLYVRETTDEEARARFRERIAREVRRAGLAPLDVASAEDLAWAFGGREAELQELEEQAAQAQAEQDEHQERAARAGALRAMTEQVLAEQDAERRRKAEAEARKRLGWKKDERP